MAINVNKINQDINPTNEIFSTPYEFDRKRISLPPLQFKDANKQKRIWLKAVSDECHLSGNENSVLEALAYLTDPINGEGVPAIGTIQEKCEEQGVYIHYETVRDCLKRLEKKGAISIRRRGKKLTNYYELIGFKYELTTCYDNSLNYPNSPPSPKEKRRGKKNFNKAKTPALANARRVSQEKDQDYDERAAQIEPERAKTFFESLRNAVREIN